MNKLKGYSFIEILTTLTILGVLLATSCGTFRMLLARYFSESVASTLFHHLQFARTEAVKRNQIVALCPSQDFQSCSDDWTNGYMVFIVQENFPISPNNVLRTLDIPSSVRINSANQPIIKYYGNGQSLRATITVSLQETKEKIVIYDSGRTRIMPS